MRISDWSSDVCSSDLLVERCHDAAFDAEFDLAGNFVKRSEKGKLYWYYEPPMTDGSRPRKYVGPDSDPAVASRVEGFGRLKTGFRERQRLVRSEEHTSELQSLMRISYAVFCLTKKNNKYNSDKIAK